MLHSNNIGYFPKNFCSPFVDDIEELENNSVLPNNEENIDNYQIDDLKNKLKEEKQLREAENEKRKKMEEFFQQQLEEFTKLLS